MSCFTISCSRFVDIKGLIIYCSFWVQKFFTFNPLYPNCFAQFKYQVRIQKPSLWSLQNLQNRSLNDQAYINGLTYLNCIGKSSSILEYCTMICSRHKLRTYKVVSSFRRSCHVFAWKRFDGPRLSQHPSSNNT